MEHDAENLCEPDPTKLSDPDLDDPSDDDDDDLSDVYVIPVYVTFDSCIPALRTMLYASSVPRVGEFFMEGDGSCYMVERVIHMVQPTTVDSPYPIVIPEIHLCALKLSRDSRRPVQLKVHRET